MLFDLIIFSKNYEKVNIFYRDWGLQIFSLLMRSDKLLGGFIRGCGLLKVIWLFFMQRLKM